MGDASPLRGLRVIVVGPQAPPVGGMTVQAGLLATCLALDGARVVRVATNPRLAAPLARTPFVGGSLRLATFRSRLRRAIAQGADVVHVQSASWTYFRRVTRPVIDAARAAGIRCVVRWDGGEADRFFATAPRRIGEVLARADEIVVPSPWMRDVFRARLAIVPRVIPNLIEDVGVELPSPRARGPLRLFCARHLETSYGVDVVLAAAAIAVRSGVDLVIVVAGDGRRRAALEAFAARELPGRATFLGAVPRDRVLTELRESDVVVNGSRVDNAPVALAEALAAGVPVATTSAGGISWIVEHGSTGLVTPVDDVAALAASIVRFDADRAALEAFGWRAKISALRWTWDALGGEWASAYGAASRVDPF